MRTQSLSHTWALLTNLSVSFRGREASYKVTDMSNTGA